jgi:hypothetical protein
MSFVVIRVDCADAYTYGNAPSPSQPRYVWNDDVYADRYRSRYGEKVDHSLVLPVLNALQGQPEAGALWDKHINKILDDLDIEIRSTGRSSFCAEKSSEGSTEV